MQQETPSLRFRFSQSRAVAAPNGWPASTLLVESCGYRTFLQSQATGAAKETLLSGRQELFQACFPSWIPFLPFEALRHASSWALGWDSQIQKQCYAIKRCGIQWPMCPSPLRNANRCSGLLLSRLGWCLVLREVDSALHFLMLPHIFSWLTCQVIQSILTIYFKYKVIWVEKNLKMPFDTQGNVYKMLILYKGQMNTKHDTHWYHILLYFKV